ncbi:O-fucosyltransferase 37-like [Nymphaea colorata]|nr:O-fucosyltransferase 37-like [Nymphaea colorata]
MAAAKNSLSLNSILLHWKPSFSGQSSSPRLVPPRHCLLPFLFIFSIFLAVLKFSFLISISETPSTCHSSSSLIFRSKAVLSPVKNTKTLAPALDVDNLPLDERAFWQQPDGGRFRSCLQFSLEYRKASSAIAAEKRRFLMVVVSGKLGQQKNEIVDAVVIARILGAALVLPILEANSLGKDDSADFGDIFDVEHFKETLKSDVRIVSSLPSSHLGYKAVAERIPFHATPLWIRSRFKPKLNKHGALLLKGIYLKLSRNLPLDLQRLRCKVAFQALRFAADIRETGSRLADRMRADGPYIALHLRLEKDVWIQTGCLPGLSSKHDALIAGMIRRRRPEAISSSLNMSHHQRRLSGLCPLNAGDVARLLKALGAPASAGVYWGGESPFGGSHALEPLADRFPHLTTMEALAHPGELEPLMNRSSALDAVDYTVFLASHVFMASHDGSMAQAMKGHRAFAGHRKSIEPNKRAMAAAAPLPEVEFADIMKLAHRNSVGQPEPRAGRQRKDVTACPVPECVCKGHGSTPAW